jgi:hypothetical protein
LSPSHGLMATNKTSTRVPVGGMPGSSQSMRSEWLRDLSQPRERRVPGEPRLSAATVIRFEQPIGLESIDTHHPKRQPGKVLERMVRIASGSSPTLASDAGRSPALRPIRRRKPVSTKRPWASLCALSGASCTSCGRLLTLVSRWAQSALATGAIAPTLHLAHGKGRAVRLHGGSATVYAILTDNSLCESSHLNACDVATVCAWSAWSRRDARSPRRDPLPGGSRRRCARAG